jgi:hypothetical protein
MEGGQMSTDSSPRDYNKRLTEGQIAARRVIVATLIGTGMSETLLSEKIGVPLNVIRSDHRWMKNHRPDVLESARSSFLQDLRLDPDTDIKSVMIGTAPDASMALCDLLNSIYGNIDQNEIHQNLIEVEDWNKYSDEESVYDAFLHGKIVGNDPTTHSLFDFLHRDGVHFYEMGTMKPITPTPIQSDSTKPTIHDDNDGNAPDSKESVFNLNRLDVDAAGDSSNEHTTLTSDEESAFKDLVSELGDIGSTVYKDEFFRAAKIISVQIVSRPVIGGRLYGKSKMIIKFMDAIIDDVRGGMYKIRSSPMTLAISTVIVDQSGEHRTDPEPLATVSMRTEWMASGGMSRKTTPEEEEAIVAWITALKNRDPEAFSYVDSIQVPIGVKINDDGEIVPGMPPMSGMDLGVVGDDDDDDGLL